MRRVTLLLLLAVLGLAGIFQGCTTEQIASIIEPEKQIKIEIMVSPETESGDKLILKDKVDVAIRVAGGEGLEIEELSAYVDDLDKPLALEFAGDDTWVGQWDTNNGNFPNGSHVLAAVLKARDGKVYSNSKVFEIENEQGAPVVRIASPLSNSEVIGIVNIVAEASVEKGVISKVEFYLDNQLKASLNEGPFQYAWNTLEYKDKNYTWKVMAYDDEGRVAQDAINLKVNNNLLPTVNLTAPLAGETLSKVKVLKAEASAKNGKSILKVEFYGNGKLLGTASVVPYTHAWDTEKEENGSYDLFVRAYDSGGKQADSLVKKIAINNTVEPEDAKPEITVFSPVDGEQGLGGEIKITGKVTDDKALNKVELLMGGAVIKTYSLNQARSFDLDYAVFGQTAGPLAALSQINPTAEEYPEVKWEKINKTFEQLNMYIHVPKGMIKTEKKPLLVVMHGCLQTAADYEHDTQWNVLSDAHKFYVVHVENPSGVGYNQCFDWYSSTANSGGGSAKGVKDMIAEMKTRYNIDGTQVYLTGVSAGAALSVILLSNYPDQFAGGALMASIPFKGYVGSAFSCLSYIQNCTNKTPGQWAALMPKNPGKYPKIIEFHGTSDSYVNPCYQNELMEQWTQAQGADQTADVSEKLKGHNYKEYHHSDGRVLVATVTLDGMAHGIAVDPNGTGEDKGGKVCAVSGPTTCFSFDMGIYSSYHGAKYLGLIGGVTPPPADEAPNVNISAPQSGASNLQGTVSVVASATDDKALVKAEFYVNGVIKDTKNINGTKVNVSFSWNTGGLAHGAYSLTVKVYDSLSQIGEHTVTVAVGEGVPQIGPGSHILMVKAYDSIGQVSESEVRFNVGELAGELSIILPGREFKKPEPVVVNGASAHAVQIEVQLVGPSSGKVYDTVLLKKEDFPAGLESWSASLSTDSIFFSGTYWVVAKATDSGDKIIESKIEVKINK